MEELFKREGMEVTYIKLEQAKELISSKMKDLLGLKNELEFEVRLSISQNWVNLNMDLDQLTDNEFKKYCHIFGEEIVGDSILDRLLELVYGEENSFKYLVDDFRGFYIIKEVTNVMGYKKDNTKYVLSFNTEQFDLDFYTGNTLGELKESIGKKTMLELYNEFLDCIGSDTIADDLEEAEDYAVVGIYTELYVDDELGIVAPKIEHKVKFSVLAQIT